MLISTILLFLGVSTLLLEPDPLTSLPYYVALAVCLMQIFWLSRRGLVSLAAILLTANLILQQVALSDLVRGPGTVGAPLVYA